MADFKIAYGITNKSEGGYSFNPDDHGKETYGGISRKFWPNWEGWHHIDTIKENYGVTATIINSYAKRDVVLQSLKQDFYKSNFWNPLKLDLVNDQQIANVVYDFGVNAGVGTSAKMIQKVLGTLVVDGQIGTKTLSAINGANQLNVYNTFNIARYEYYHKLALDPTQHQFLASWMSRIKPYIS